MEPQGRVVWCELTGSDVPLSSSNTQLCSRGPQADPQKSRLKPLIVSSYRAALRCGGCGGSR